MKQQEQPSTTETAAERIVREIEEYKLRVPQVPENIGVL